MTTRRDLIKMASAVAAMAAVPADLAAEDDRLPTGCKGDFVLLGTKGRGWEIHKGMVGTESARTLRVDMFSMGRTDDGEWWMGLRPDRSKEWSHRIKVDDVGAIAFLDTFSDILTYPPTDETYGTYRFSEIAARARMERRS